MKTDDHLNDKNQPVNGRLALMVFSIGAIIGALISMVLLRTNRIKAFFQKAQPYSEPSMDGEANIGETASLVTDSSSSQEGLMPEDPSTTSQVQMSDCRFIRCSDSGIIIQDQPARSENCTPSRRAFQQPVECPHTLHYGRVPVPGNNRCLVCRTVSHSPGDRRGIAGFIGRSVDQVFDATLAHEKSASSWAYVFLRGSHRGADPPAGSSIVSAGF